ncbi:TPA: ead/Ea22-like family protein [Klebsiella quasipneumoniae]|nr:ead/Ea22-like family protein [Klebsiella quasipneumoniae]
MTDITELAQSLKAAANKAGADDWQAKKISGDFYVIRKGSYSSQCGYRTYQPIAEIDHKSTRDYVAIASPANVLALVEALEKAQQVDEELCKLLPPGVEYMDPPDGGDVTPLEGVRRMVADYRQRIAELESRSVTVKLTDINEYLADVHDKTLNRAFRLLAEGVRSGDVAAMRAAGIKVEAE